MLCVRLVAELEILSETPGTTAPDESVIRPTTDADGACASRAMGAARSEKANRVDVRRGMLGKVYQQEVSTLSSEALALALWSLDQVEWPGLRPANTSGRAVFHILRLNSAAYCCRKI